jgi:putative membrane protein
MSESAGRDPRVTLAEERTRFATFRTSMAMDRTTLAWVRTTLTMSSFGLGMIGFFRSLRMENPTPESVRMHQGAVHFGVTLVVIGVVATVLVAVSHLSGLRKLRTGETLEAAKWPLSITVALLLALLALWGLWVVFYG